MHLTSVRCIQCRVDDIEDKFQIEGKLASPLPIKIFQSYSREKFAAVLMISVGVAACTLKSGTSMSDRTRSTTSTDPNSRAEFLWWVFGLAMMALSLFVMAGMGIYQEIIYKKYGRCADEAKYYCVRQLT